MSGRRAAAVGLTVLATLGLVSGARAWSVAADSHRRSEEHHAYQSYLNRQLAHRDAVLESQRRIYMERFRRLEAQVRQREQDVAALRARLRTHPAASAPDGAD
jgi:tRNA C32,U32 (ribose-2'-O)-methylase TrmJ